MRSLLSIVTGAARMAPIAAVSIGCLWGGQASAAPVQWAVADGGNGHWYDIVVADSASLSGLATGIDFQAALKAAAQSGGYLATPDLAGEADFIYNNLVGPTANGVYQGYWLGVYAQGSSQGWQWSTGEPVTSWGGKTYIDWNEGDVPSGIAQFANNWWTGGASLQDVTQAALLNGYVVERPAPAPAAGLLLALGLPGLYRAARARRRPANR